MKLPATNRKKERQSEAELVDRQRVTGEAGQSETEIDDRRRCDQEGV